LSKYICFNKNLFQQCADEEIYRTKEKLVYRFISNKPVFAFDSQGYYALNSANILIPNIKGHSIFSVLAYLNSNVFRFLFDKLFNTRKVLKSDLQRLPFPVISEDDLLLLNKTVKKAINGEDVENEINQFVNKSFKLTRKEEEYIKKLK
jgi:hypothetical protein